MTSSYGLYHTLDKNISKNKKVSTKSLNTLHGWLNSIKDPTQLENVFMLIHEHATVTGLEFSDSKLPYGLTYKKDGTHFNLEKLPNELIQILIKFMNLGE